MSVREAMKLCLDSEVLASKLKDEEVKTMSLQKQRGREKVKTWCEGEVGKSWPGSTIGPSTMTSCPDTKMPHTQCHTPPPGSMQ